MGAPVRPQRPTWFVWGIAFGVLLPLVFAAAIIALISWHEPKYNVEIEVDGADAARVGARRIDLWSANGLILKQICHDACDDLSYRTYASDNAFAVHVLYRTGACVACSGTDYVTHGMGVSRLRAAGADPFTFVRTVFGKAESPLIQRGGQPREPCIFEIQSP